MRTGTSAHQRTGRPRIVRTRPKCRLRICGALPRCPAARTRAFGLPGRGPRGVGRAGRPTTTARCPACSRRGTGWRRAHSPQPVVDVLLDLRWLHVRVDVLPLDLRVVVAVGSILGVGIDESQRRNQAHVATPVVIQRHTERSPESRMETRRHTHRLAVGALQPGVEIARLALDVRRHRADHDRLRAVLDDPHLVGQAIAQIACQAERFLLGETGDLAAVLGAKPA